MLLVFFTIIVYTICVPTSAFVDLSGSRVSVGWIHAAPGLEDTMKDTRKCKVCDRVKPIEKFRRTGTYRANTCKRCHSKAMRIQQRKRAVALQRLARMKGCLCCGRKDAKRFHYHHPSEKNFQLSNVCNRSRKTFRSELALAHILCPSCHFVIHYALRRGIPGRKFSRCHSEYLKTYYGLEINPLPLKERKEGKRRRAFDESRERFHYAKKGRRLYRFTSLELLALWIAKNPQERARISTGDNFVTSYLIKKYGRWASIKDRKGIKFAEKLILDADFMREKILLPEEVK